MWDDRIVSALKRSGAAKAPLDTRATYVTTNMY